MGVPIAGWLAWYVWAMVYLLKMVGLRKQIEVLFDIVRGFFVEHDTSQIHPRRVVLRERDLEPGLTGRESAGAAGAEARRKEGV